MRPLTLLSRFSYKLRLLTRFGYFIVISNLIQRARWKLTGIDLAAESNEHTGVGSSHGNRHDPTGPFTLAYAFKKFDLAGRIHSALDVGCGKGAALITLHNLGLRDLGGIDLSARLVHICRKNLLQLCITADVSQQNAVDFVNFGPYDLFYLFNPFPRNALTAFLDHMQTFVEQNKTTKFILFKNPKDEDLFARPGLQIANELDEPARILLIRVQPVSSDLGQ